MEYGEELYSEETYSETTESSPAGNGAYNFHLYNETNYNAAVLILALFESLSATDDRSMQDFTATKEEMLTLIDTLQRFFNGQILAETLTPSDVLLKDIAISKADLVTLNDLRTALTDKSLTDTVTLSDLRSHFMQTNKVEALLLVDTLQKFISNKRVTETIRLQDWLSVKKNPAESIWSD